MTLRTKAKENRMGQSKGNRKYPSCLLGCQPQFEGIATSSTNWFLISVDL